MHDLETLEAKAAGLFQSGFFKASALLYVQAHCLISNLTGCAESLTTPSRRELKLQNVKLLMNAAMAYIKSAQLELSMNQDGQELIFMANSYARHSFELLQEYFGVPRNITQKNIRRLFQKPLNVHLLELPNLLKDPTRLPIDVLPDHRTEWTFILCLISWSK
jgi:hypothetical protein